MAAGSGWGRDYQDGMEWTVGRPFLQTPFGRVNSGAYSDGLASQTNLCPATAIFGVRGAPFARGVCHFLRKWAGDDAQWRKVDITQPARASLACLTVPTTRA